MCSGITGMRANIIVEGLTRAFKQRNQAVIFGAIIAFSNVLLTGYLFIRKERVVIVPAQINQEFWVERRVVSKEYLEEMALFFVNLLLDATPHSMQYQRNTILRNTDPKEYDGLKNKLIREEERYRKENLATTFSPTKIVINTSKLQALVSGYLTSYVSGKQVKQSEDSYVLTFRYDAGRLYILSFRDAGVENAK